MLLFYANVVKVGWDVARVAMVILYLCLQYGHWSSTGWIEGPISRQPSPWREAGEGTQQNADDNSTVTQIRRRGFEMRFGKWDGNMDEASTIDSSLLEV